MQERGCAAAGSGGLTLLHRANDEQGDAREGDPEEHGEREGAPADGFDGAWGKARADEEEGELEAELGDGLGGVGDGRDEGVVEVEERGKERPRGACEDEPENKPRDGARGFRR